jgi:hypothetical protein
MNCYRSKDAKRSANGSMIGRYERKEPWTIESGLQHRSTFQGPPTSGTKYSIVSPEHDDDGHTVSEIFSSPVRFNMR